MSNHVEKAANRWRHLTHSRAPKTRAAEVHRYFISKMFITRSIIIESQSKCYLGTYCYVPRCTNRGLLTLIFKPQTALGTFCVTSQSWHELENNKNKTENVLLLCYVHMSDGKNRCVSDAVGGDSCIVPRCEDIAKWEMKTKHRRSISVKPTACYWCSD